MKPLRVAYYLLLGLLMLLSPAAGRADPGQFLPRPTLPMLTFEFPPYHYMEEGQPKGASVEIIELIVGRLGYRPEIHLMPWRRAQRGAASGRFAGVFTFTYSPARAEQFYYSQPLSFITDIFYGRQGEVFDWQRLDDLSAYRIGISGGYNYVPEFMAAMAEGRLRVEVISSDAPELQQLEQLRHGRIDLALCIESRCADLKRRRPSLFAGLEQLEKPVGPARSFHVGFAKNWPGALELQRAFDRELAIIAADGTLATILARYHLP